MDLNPGDAAYEMHRPLYVAPPPQPDALARADGDVRDER